MSARHSDKLAREAERLATYTLFHARQHAQHRANRERQCVELTYDMVGPYRRYWVRTLAEGRPEGTELVEEFHPQTELDR